MKRWILLAGLVVVFTAAATAALQFLPDEEAPAPGGVSLMAPETNSGPQPKVEVLENLMYSFGSAPQQTILAHDWVFKNTGSAPLTLWKGPVKCSCTVANFAGNKESIVLKPGESTTVHLTFETRTYNGHYRKEGEILTDDPIKQSINLMADGEIRPAVAVYPDPTVQYAEISNDLPDHIMSVAILSPDKEDLKVTKLETSRPEIVATQEPLSEEDCKKLKVKQGVKVILNVKSGMPLGSFREEVVVQTDHPRQPEMRLTLLGLVVGPITVSPSRLHLPDVSSSQGAEREMRLVVRGRRATKFEVLSTPEKVQARVVSNENSDKTGLYKLVVTVPPGTLPGTIEDQIVLKSDHPNASEVKVPVEIYIRDAG
jgi:hypothetical protein